MRNMHGVVTLAVVLLLAISTTVPASAQDTEGYLYVARGGDIIAMRPDGSGAVNLTQTPLRIEDEPDVSNASGRDMFIHLLEEGANGQFVQGIGTLNLVSGGVFENLPPQSGAQYGDPSKGVFDDALYVHDRFRQIVRFDVFEGGTPQELPGTNNFENVFQPDGSPIAENGVAYVATGFGSSSVRVQDPAIPQDGAIGGAGDNYTNARYPHYTPDGTEVVFACRNGTGKWEFCRAGISATSPTFSIIPTPTDVMAPVVSPTGSRIAWRDLLGNVWVANVDGSNAVQVANGDGGDDPALGLDWGPEIPLVGAPPAEEPPPPTEPDPAPNTPLMAGGADGDPTTTERAEFSQPGPLSVGVSEARFPDVGSTFAGKEVGADFAILSRDDAFADSLAGSPLTARGPLLFTSSEALSDAVGVEIQRILVPGDTVYLLGGEVALNAAVEQAVTDLGMTPRRLAGPSRFETGVAVAEEVIALGGSTTEVIVARGNGPADNPTAAWADSVSGGAYAAAEFVPVVVTPTTQVHPAVAAFIDGTGATATLLGGTAALTQEVEDALPGSRRIAGASRADTAAMIATDLIGIDGGAERTVLLFDIFSEDGWTFGLAGAGLAADLGGALLGVQRDSIPPETANLLANCGDPIVETIILGWDGVITPEVEAEIDDIDGNACS